MCELKCLKCVDFICVGIVSSASGAGLHMLVEARHHRVAAHEASSLVVTLITFPYQKTSLAQELLERVGLISVESKKGYCRVLCN